MVKQPKKKKSPETLKSMYRKMSRKRQGGLKQKIVKKVSTAEINNILQLLGQKLQLNEKVREPPQLDAAKKRLQQLHTKNEGCFSCKFMEDKKKQTRRKQIPVKKRVLKTLTKMKKK